MIKIAGNLTINDWRQLADLKPDLNIDNQWASAYQFFEQRIETRYLRPINEILDMDLKTGEGFAVVNLQCSLIETIECFIQGWIHSHNKWYYRKVEGEMAKNKLGKDLKNSDIFVSFFANRKSFKPFKIDGQEFFTNVRCGLLHETQTKKKWIIKAADETNIYKESSLGEKIIYRNNLQLAIKSVLEEYKKAIIEGSDFDEISNIDLRENFKAKFNHICNESE